SASCSTFIAILLRRIVSDILYQVPSTSSRACSAFRGAKKCQGPPVIPDVSRTSNSSVGVSSTAYFSFAVRIRKLTPLDDSPHLDSIPVEGGFGSGERTSISSGPLMGSAPFALGSDDEK